MDYLTDLWSLSGVVFSSCPGPLKYCIQYLRFYLIWIKVEGLFTGFFPCIIHSARNSEF